jgi:nucleoid DNA-binding protein
MAAFIGPALLRRLVAKKAGVAEDVAAAVMDCVDDCVLDLLKRGARVRLLGVGYFEIKKTKATRRWSPMTEGFVKVPARKKIVFRESRKK